MTSFRLAVWRNEETLSHKDAAKHYEALMAGSSSQTFSEAVYGFCSDLSHRYPDPDALSDDQLESCPWACALDFSGCHVIISLMPDRYAEVFPLILELADRYGLICYDPQNDIVHRPSGRLGA